MEKYLLDTNALIRVLFDSNKLSEKALEVVTQNHLFYISVVSLWEIAIKQSIGKLDLEYSIVTIADKCNDAGINIVEIGANALDKIKELPDYHKDPFDRLIIATAMVESMTIITSDSIIPRYDVRVVW